MIEINLIWILIVVLLLGCFAFLAFFTIFGKKENDEFSLLSHFPNELVDNNPKFAKVYMPFLYALAALMFSPIFVILPNITSFGDLRYLPILISCLFGLEGFAFIMLHFYKVKFTKIQAILSAILMLLSLLTSLLVVVFSTSTLKWLYKMNEPIGLQIVGVVLSGLTSLGSAFLAINPKLKDWAKLKEVEGEEGIYERPKIFILAFSQWISFSLSIIAELALMISMLK